MKEEASILQIKEYFEYASNTEFMMDWKELSDDEKKYFKEAVGQEVN
jgi:hypothetical protein